MECEATLGLRPGAVVFMASGQGSQKPGMGVDLLDVPEVAESFATASQVFGFNVAELVSSGTAEELNDTRNAQAAITALSIGIGRALMAHGIRPDALLGFSLGQISAMALAGMMDDKTAFEVIRERAACMGAACDAHGGAMSALLKGDTAEVEALVEENALGQVLVAANYNCPGQTVISGEESAVARAEEAWAARGHRASRLATSGAFHSPLMEDATQPFGAFLEDVEFQEPLVPVIHNADARPLVAVDARRALVEHLTHPVLFEQSVRLLAEAGATRFVEVGFGGVLTGLVRRIDRNLERLCVQDRASLDQALVTLEDSPVHSAKDDDSE